MDKQWHGATVLLRLFLKYTTSSRVCQSMKFNLYPTSLIYLRGLYNLDSICFSLFLSKHTPAGPNLTYGASSLWIYGSFFQSIHPFSSASYLTPLRDIDKLQFIQHFLHIKYWSVVSNVWTTNQFFHFYQPVLTIHFFFSFQSQQNRFMHPKYF